MSIDPLFFSGNLDTVLPVFCLFNNISVRFHNERLFLCRTDVRTVSAAQAVQSRQLHSVLQPFHAFAVRLDGHKTFRSCRLLCFIQQHRSDGSMRTYEGALVTLDTFIRLPFRQVYSYTTLFVCSSSRWECTIFDSIKCAYRQIVTFLTIHRDQDILDKFRQFFVFFSWIFYIDPAFRNIDLADRSDSLIYCSTVHVYDVLSLFLICFFDTFFQVFYCLFNRNNTCQFKECSLHYHVDSGSKANIFCDFPCIDSIEINVFLCQISLHFCREHLVDFFIGPQTVKQERSTLFQVLQHIVLSDVCLVMAGYEIRLVDKISGLNRMLPESQVRYCQTSGFLGVVCEISLGIHIRLITNDLDSSFVRTYCTIRTQTPELTLDSAFRFSGDTFRIRQRVTRYIIFDTDREVVLWFLMIQVVIDRMYHTRCRVLRAQSVTPSVNFRSISLSVKQSLYILIKRLTQGTRLLGSV